MALPVTSKTWSFNVNNYASDRGSILALTVKNAVLGFAAQPWTCWGSCDSVGFGNGDGVERWIDSGDIVFSAGAHSWFVFNVPGFNPKTQLLMECGSVVTYANFRFSYSAGFGAANGGTDGDATTRPTATDEINIARDQYWSGPGSSGDWIVHAMQATDGSAHRVFMIHDSKIRSMWMIEVPKNPISGWTDPLIATTSGDQIGNDVLSAEGGGNVSRHLIYIMYGGGSRSCVFTYDNTRDGPVHLLGPDQVTHESFVGGAGVYCTASGYEGRKCELYDMWWGGALTGDSYPGGNFGQLGEMVVPWNGTKVLVF